MKKHSLLLLVGFLVGCSAPLYDESSDYDQQTDFAKYKTFNWIPTPSAPEANKFVVQRVQNAVKREMAAKGVTMATTSPDLLIAQHLGKTGKVEVINHGYRYGGYGGYGRYGGRYGGVSTYEYEEGSLILDFVDATSKELVWRGSIKAEVQYVNSTEEREKLINTAVGKILKDYPPSPASK